MRSIPALTRSDQNNKLLKWSAASTVFGDAGRGVDAIHNDPSPCPESVRFVGSGNAGWSRDDQGGDAAGVAALQLPKDQGITRDCGIAAENNAPVSRLVPLTAINAPASRTEPRRDDRADRQQVIAIGQPLSSFTVPPALMVATCAGAEGPSPLA